MVLCNTVPNSNLVRPRVLALIIRHKRNVRSVIVYLVNLYRLEDLGRLRITIIVVVGHRVCKQTIGIHIIAVIIAAAILGGLHRLEIRQTNGFAALVAETMMGVVRGGPAAAARAAPNILEPRRSLKAAVAVGAELG